MESWKLKKLQSQNFRNLGNQVFDFVPGINCIFGENGNGKTNLLEAVFLLTNKKSFRKNTSYPQLINVEGGQPEIILQSAFSNDKDLLAYSMRMGSEHEERFLNNTLEKSKTPVSSVFINPFDSYSFHTSSTFRRQWMDSHLSLMDSDYRKILGKFQKSMRFRNSVLSIGGKNGSNQLKAIDEQVSEYSEIITVKRLDFISGLNQQITSTFKAVFAEEHQLQLDLESLFSLWDKKKIYDFYRHQESIDFKAQVTQVGVHRDDFIFHFDGLNAFEFCSLGQQKMAFLSLIFAYIELFRYKFSSYPIVLIDDVSGELDSRRWENLIRYLETKKFQVLITTANENFGKELERIPNSKKFLIEHGTLA
jgi:DNA replication and repair protein RecF